MNFNRYVESSLVDCVNFQISNKKRSRPFLIRQNEIVTFIVKHHESWFGSFSYQLIY